MCFWTFVLIEVGQVCFVVGQVIFWVQPVLGQVPEKSICQPLLIVSIRKSAFIYLFIYFLMYSFVYLLRDVDLYFNKQDIMMKLKVSGFLMPVQILKYAVICNIFMQARMKLCVSKQAGSPFWALLFICLFWRMYNASVLEYMQINATFLNLEQHDTHINSKFLSFLGYMFGLVDDLTNFIYNGNQKFINKWLNNKVMEIHVLPIPFFRAEVIEFGKMREY